MKTLKQTCIPRKSVFDTSRRDTVLDLSDLIAGNIDPYNFFEENYITDGMHRLLSGSFSRFEKKSDQGIFLLTQSMGGVTFQYRRRPWLQDPWHGDSPYFPC